MLPRTTGLRRHPWHHYLRRMRNPASFLTILTVVKVAVAVAGEDDNAGRPLLHCAPVAPGDSAQESCYLGAKRRCMLAREESRDEDGTTCGGRFHCLVKFSDEGNLCCVQSYCTKGSEARAPANLTSESRNKERVDNIQTRETAHSYGIDNLVSQDLLSPVPERIVEKKSSEKKKHHHPVADARKIFEHRDQDNAGSLESRDLSLFDEWRDLQDYDFERRGSATDDDEDSLEFDKVVEEPSDDNSSAEGKGSDSEGDKRLLRKLKKLERKKMKRLKRRKRRKRHKHKRRKKHDSKEDREDKKETEELTEFRRTASRERQEEDSNAGGGGQDYLLGDLNGSREQESDEESSEEGESESLTSEEELNTEELVLKGAMVNAYLNSKAKGSASAEDQDYAQKEETHGGNPPQLLPEEKTFSVSSEDKFLKAKLEEKQNRQQRRRQASPSVNPVVEEERQFWDKVDFSGPCVRESDTALCVEKAKASCKERNDLLCGGKGSCSVSEEVDSCCSRLECQVAAVEPDRCHAMGKGDNCTDDMAGDKCLQEKMQRCKSGGRCSHFVKDSKCCYKSVCDGESSKEEEEEKSQSDVLTGPGVRTVPVAHPRECNRMLCPILPQVCPQEGSCLVRSRCGKGGKDCTCRIEVRCFDNARHAFEIEYEFDEEPLPGDKEQRHTKEVNIVESGEGAKNISISISEGGKVNTSMENITVQKETTATVTPTSTQHESRRESWHQTDYRLETGEEMQKVESEESLSREYEDSSSSEEQGGRREGGTNRNMIRKVPWAKTALSSATTPPTIGSKPPAKDKKRKAFRSRIISKHTTSDEGEAGMGGSLGSGEVEGSNYGYFEDNLKRGVKGAESKEEWQRYEEDYEDEDEETAETRRFKEKHFAKKTTPQALPSSTTSTAKLTKAPTVPPTSVIARSTSFVGIGLFKQKCVEVPPSSYDVKTIPDFAADLVADDLRSIGRASFFVRNITQCSDQVCSQVGSNVCGDKGGGGGTCRAFGRCRGEGKDPCKCTLRAQCDLESSVRRDISDVSPADLTRMLSEAGGRKRAEFSAAKAEDCSDTRCAGVGKVCPTSGVCRTERRCFGARCRCAVSVQCLDEDGKPERSSTSKGDIGNHPDLIEAKDFARESGGNISLTLEQLFMCTEKVLCPHFDSSCGGASRTCNVHPTCDQAMPMCIVSIECGKEGETKKQPPRKKAFRTLVNQRPGMKPVDSETSITVKVKDKEECLHNVCTRLSRKSPKCKDVLFCSLKGECPTESGICMCKVHGNCLGGGAKSGLAKGEDQDVLKHNVSHLIIPSPPPAGSAEGFEIVSVEATTEEGSGEREYEDLEREAGRKPFMKTKIARRTPIRPANRVQISRPTAEPEIITTPVSSTIMSTPVDMSTMSSGQLAEALRGGGNASIRVSDMKDCNETVCSELRDVCDQVGTCWTETMCREGPNRDCRCIISVQCHKQVGIGQEGDLTGQERAFRRYSFAKRADQQSLRTSLGETGGEVDVSANNITNCQEAFCKDKGYACLEVGKGGGKCQAELSCMQDKCLCNVKVACPGQRPMQNRMAISGKGISSTLAAPTATASPSAPVLTTSKEAVGGLIVFAKEVSVKFVVKGLVQTGLQPKLACVAEELCERMISVCQPGDEPDCEVTPQCSKDQCECHVKTTCPDANSTSVFPTPATDFHPISSTINTTAVTVNGSGKAEDVTSEDVMYELKRKGINGDSQDYSLGEESPNNEEMKQNIVLRNVSQYTFPSEIDSGLPPVVENGYRLRLPSFHLKEFASRSELESSGLQKCLRTCYGFEGGCRDVNACRLRVQCFHDHCVCDMSLRCAAAAASSSNDTSALKQNDIKEPQLNRAGVVSYTQDAAIRNPKLNTFMWLGEIGGKESCQDEESACSGVTSTCPSGNKAKCKVVRLCSSGTSKCVCSLSLDCQEDFSKMQEEFVSMVSHAFMYSADKLFRTGSRISQCNRHCLRTEKKKCESAEETFACYANHELKGGYVHCKIRYGCLKTKRETGASNGNNIGQDYVYKLASSSVVKSPPSVEVSKARLKRMKVGRSLEGEDSSGSGLRDMNSESSSVEKLSQERLNRSTSVLKQVGTPRGKSTGSTVLHTRVSSVEDCSVDLQCPPVGKICADYGKCTTHGTCQEGRGADCQCSVNVMCERSSQEVSRANKEMVEQLKGGGQVKILVTSLRHCTDKECPSMDEVCLPTTSKIVGSPGILGVFSPTGGGGIAKGKCDVQGMCKDGRCFCTIKTVCL